MAEWMSRHYSMDDMSGFIMIPLNQSIIMADLLAICPITAIIIGRIWTQDHVYYTLFKTTRNQL